MKKVRIRMVAEPDWCKITRGRDETYFAILSVQSRGTTSYYPCVIDGEEVSYSVCIDRYGPDSGIDMYYNYKVKQERETIRLIVAGNPVAAESALIGMGYRALATSPTTVDIFLEEEQEEGGEEDDDL